MSERFNHLFQLPPNLYAPNLPIIISAGALLKDNLTNTVLVQLKFQNLSNKHISALKISILPYTIDKEPPSPVNNYQYLNLDVAPENFWGSDKAIVMPAPTRYFSISDIEILFDDHSTRKSADDTAFTALPKAISLETELHNIELVKQYQLETNARAIYVPQQFDYFWRCSCGNLNCTGLCNFCHISKDKLFSAYNLQALSEHATARQNDEKESELKYRKNLKRFKSCLFGATIIVSAILTFKLWLLPKVIVPYTEYTKAIALYDQKQYAEARLILLRLDGYRNSDELIKDIPYKKAEDLLEAKQYEEAIKAFKNLGDYKDSASKILQSSYEYAKELEHGENYIAALQWYTKAQDYSDASSHLEKLKGIIYTSALDLYSKEDFISALSYFSAIPDYKDSASYTDICNYKQGKILYDMGDFPSALEYFENLPSDYADADSNLSALLENCNVATDYLNALNTLERADKFSNTHGSAPFGLENAIKTYTSIRERGELLTGKTLSSEKCHMIEMYNLYLPYSGTHYSDFSFLGTLTADLVFTHTESTQGYFSLSIKGTLNYLRRESISDGKLQSEHYILSKNSAIIYHDSTGDGPITFLYS